MANTSVLGFIGRGDILSGLEDRILRKKQHVAVNGLPQIGKTQILKAVGRRLNNMPDGPRVVQTYLDGRPFQDALLLFMSNLTDCFPEAQMSDLETAEAKGSDGELLDHLRTLLLNMTRKRDLVWILDEFELLFGGENPWTEEQYGGFIRKVLLDEDLSGRLVLLVASRPTVSSLLTRYEQRLNPFVSETILSFDLRDMEEYYARLKEVCAFEPGQAERMLIRRHCGRYPKLLALLAMQLKLTGGDLTAALEKCAGTFNSQFEDTVRLMAREEKTAMHSFSSIVRCYFNPTADDGETVNRFYALGYVEKYLLPGDPLPQGDYPYPYMTVSPVFTDYLFKNHLDAKTFSDITVPGISDPRMLLAGLVGTLRRITKDVLSPQFTGRDWNTEVLLNKCALDAGGGRYYEYEFYQEGSRTKIKRKNYYLVTGAAGRIVFSSPVFFLSKAYDSSPRSGTWLLDPINLNDHANLIISYASRFAPYFQEALNANLANSAAQTALRNIFSKLKDARDGYAHYLFSGQVTAGQLSLQDQQTANLCKKLLRSIYSHLYVQ